MLCMVVNVISERGKFNTNNISLITNYVHVYYTFSHMYITLSYAIFD